MSKTSNKPDLPHHYPFRLVEVGADEVVIACPTGAGRLGANPLSVAYAVEMMAQSAAVLLDAGLDPGLESGPESGLNPGDGKSASKQESLGVDQLALAGIQSAVLHEPILAGTRLRARAETLGRFGSMTKAKVALVTEHEGQAVAEAELLLSRR